MPKRIFIPPHELPDSSAGRPIELPDDAEHYARDVLRLERGDEIELFDGEGRIIRGKLQSIGRSGVKVIPEVDRHTERAESPCEVELFQAIPKGDRWRMVLEKTTELGVRRIVPLETTRTVVEIPDERADSKLSRWRRIVGNAARQCGRSHTPDIDAPRTLDEITDRREDETDTIGVPGASLMLATTPKKSDDAPSDRASDPPELHAALSETTGDTVGLWIGPEGGFTAEEQRALQNRGIQPVRFGPRILRSETAGIAAVTAAQLIRGDL